MAEPKSLSDIGKDALARLATAREHKAAFDPDLREAYLFAAPHRHRAMNSENPKTTKPQDVAPCDTSFAAELTGDFVTLIMNTFMPEAERWASRKPGWTIPKEAQEAVSRQVMEADEVIFDAINSSNFHSECAKGFDPDLACGTVAMWLDDPGPWGQLRAQAVPLSELEISLGPDGAPDFRAWVRHTRNRSIPAVLKGIKLPEKIEKTIKEKPNHVSILRRCFWRDWQVDTHLEWVYCCLVGNEPVHMARLVGSGSCPMIVGRFQPCPEWAYAAGPLIRALPDIRQYEDVDRGRTDHVSRSLRPPISYPSDSFSNIEDGIEDGMAYPVRPGEADDIKPLYDPPPVNVAIYDQQERQLRLKKMFFSDWPEQRGDTPPTASQWLDQVTMALRRIGTPGMPFWREFCAEAFLRFAYLCEARGAIKPIEVDGKGIALIPYNPAARAAEQNEVAAFARFAEIGGQAFPEEFKMLSDGGATMVALARKLGADKIWVQRDQENIEGAVGLISQLMGGQAPGAPEMGGQAMPAPGPANAPIEQRNYITGGS